MSAFPRILATNLADIVVREMIKYKRGGQSGFLSHAEMAELIDCDARGRWREIRIEAYAVAQKLGYELRCSRSGWWLEGEGLPSAKVFSKMEPTIPKTTAAVKDELIPAIESVLASLVGEVNVNASPGRESTAVDLDALADAIHDAVVSTRPDPLPEKADAVANAVDDSSTGSGLTTTHAVTHRASNGEEFTTTVSYDGRPPRNFKIGH